MADATPLLPPLPCPKQDACWRSFHDNLTAALAPAGLDIVHAFPVQVAIAAGADAGGELLPTFGRHPSTLALLVGNSAALWRPFVTHLASHPGAVDAPDPLDAYTDAAVDAALLMAQGALPPGRGVAMHVRRAHTPPGVPGHVNMLRVAAAARLAYYSPSAHLAVHPQLGPWFALRALIVLDVDGPPLAHWVPGPLPCPDESLEQRMAAATAALVARPGGASTTSWRQHWREWAALRALAGEGTDERCVAPPAAKSVSDRGCSHRGHPPPTPTHTHTHTNTSCAPQLRLMMPNNTRIHVLAAVTKHTLTLSRCAMLRCCTMQPPLLQRAAAVPLHS
jgi:cyanocobalamin reductase (cyanide-eliminating) / alkylcobalamin dealkylase